MPLQTAYIEIVSSVLQWQPGGQGAHEVLEKFVMSRLKDFSVDRSKTDTESTSRLSPHIHYGEISVRHIYYVVPPTFPEITKCFLLLCPQQSGVQDPSHCVRQGPYPAR